MCSFKLRLLVITATLAMITSKKVNKTNNTRMKVKNVIEVDEKKVKNVIEVDESNFYMLPKENTIFKVSKRTLVCCKDKQSPQCKKLKGNCMTKAKCDEDRFARADCCIGAGEKKTKDSCYCCYTDACVKPCSDKGGQKGTCRDSCHKSSEVRIASDVCDKGRCVCCKEICEPKYCKNQEGRCLLKEQHPYTTEYVGIHGCKEECKCFIKDCKTVKKCSRLGGTCYRFQEFDDLCKSSIELPGKCKGTCKCCAGIPNCKTVKKCGRLGGTCYRFQEFDDLCKSSIELPGKCKGTCKCCAGIPFQCDPECINGECTAPNICTCDPGWGGAQCQDVQCDTECINGECTAPNICTCDPGWGGAQCQDGCGPPWFLIGNQCFYLDGLNENYNNLTWSSARNFCGTKASFGDLAQPKDLQALQKYLFIVHHTLYWLGGSDLATEGEWLWINKTPITGWHQDNIGKGDCLTLHPVTTWNGGPRNGSNNLFPKDCDRTKDMKFVCEQPYEPIKLFNS